MIGDLFDDFGLFETAILEGGIWQSNVITGEKASVDDNTRFGGLKSLGINLIHTRTPRGKIIETNFHKLQSAADNVRGFCGREERKDCPEQVRKQLALVRAGHAHPREFFLHIAEYSAHLKGVMNALNYERNDGEILRGSTAADKWTEDAPQLRVMPDDAKWMYRASYRVLSVTRNGVRISVGTGKYQNHYCYSNPQALENHRNRRVVAFWNDYDPDTDAVIYTLRNGKPDKFLCVAKRVQDIPRLGASQEQMSAEATRKKLSMQHARTQRASLAPYLQRQERVITPPAAAAAPSDVAQRLEAAKTDNEVRQRNKKTVSDFVGDASALLDNSASAEALSPGTEAESNDEAKPRTSSPVESSLGNSPSESGGKKTYVLKSTGTDKTEYVDYLLQRLTQFRKAGASYGQHHHAAVTLGITQKIVAGQLKCDVHDESRFDEICAHLKEKIDATILGKKNTSKGRPNYHEFEPITDLSAEALLG